MPSARQSAAYGDRVGVIYMGQRPRVGTGRQAPRTCQTGSSRSGTASRSGAQGEHLAVDRRRTAMVEFPYNETPGRDTPAPSTWRQIARKYGAAAVDTPVLRYDDTGDGPGVRPHAVASEPVQAGVVPPPNARGVPGDVRGRAGGVGRASRALGVLPCPGRGSPRGARETVASLCASPPAARRWLPPPRRSPGPRITRYPSTGAEVSRRSTLGARARASRGSTAGRCVARPSTWSSSSRSIRAGVEVAAARACAGRAGCPRSTARSSPRNHSPIGMPKPCLRRWTRSLGQPAPAAPARLSSHFVVPRAQLERRRAARRRTRGRGGRAAASGPRARAPSTCGRPSAAGRRAGRSRCRARGSGRRRVRRAARARRPTRPRAARPPRGTPGGTGARGRRLEVGHHRRVAVVRARATTAASPRPTRAERGRCARGAERARAGARAQRQRAEPVGRVGERGGAGSRRRPRRRRRPTARR